MYIHTVAHYIPGKVVPNAYFLQINGLTDEWIQSRTGIRERRHAAHGENTNSMGIAAVQAALDRLPHPVEDIDLIVGASYTPYDTIVTLGHAVQHALGVPHIPVVYISSACSSLLNAIEVVEGYFAMGKAKRALVVASEHNSIYADETDTKAGHLWGDGAVAMFLSAERLTESDLKVRQLVTAGAATEGKATEGVLLRPFDGGIFMPHGRDVFIHACQYMAQVTVDVLAKEGLTPADLRFFIPHQANMRISRNVAEQLDLSMDQVLSNIEYLGNTGSAGCGIVLSEHWDKIQPGDRLLMAVFGGGYSYGAMLFER
ncbi:MAG: ketoacyl-ACP synthase III [Bacteroidetes bacterium]|nr:MAG: ketoacyl-ACP synthase III [Bacteroidota bacterium]